MSEKLSFFFLISMKSHPYYQLNPHFHLCQPARHPTPPTVQLIKHQSYANILMIAFRRPRNKRIPLSPLIFSKENKTPLRILISYPPSSSWWWCRYFFAATETDTAAALVCAKIATGFQPTNSLPNENETQLNSAPHHTTICSNNKMSKHQVQGESTD